MIAQSLAAAQKTIQPDFTIHSMHCYFILAGSPDVPVVYHVEHVRDGKSFATRNVQARQRGRPIFATMLSFVREGSAGRKVLRHSVEMPELPRPREGSDNINTHENERSPMQISLLPILNSVYQANRSVGPALILAQMSWISRTVRKLDTGSRLGEGYLRTATKHI